jgi:hypothetical protein
MQQRRRHSVVDERDPGHRRHLEREGLIGLAPGHRVIHGEADRQDAESVARAQHRRDPPHGAFHVVENAGRAAARVHEEGDVDGHRFE